MLSEKPFYGEMSIPRISTIWEEKQTIDTEEPATTKHKHSHKTTVEQTITYEAGTTATTETSTTDDTIEYRAATPHSDAEDPSKGDNKKDYYEITVENNANIVVTFDDPGKNGPGLVM